MSAVPPTADQARNTRKRSRCPRASLWYPRGLVEPGTLQIERLCRSLQTERIGRRIEYLESTTSTNDEAWRWVHAKDADGLVVLAEYQSAGRGRLGRTWESPRGASLLCSVVLMDQRRELTGGELCLLTAVAVRDAIAGSTDVTPTIKWPNDLVVKGRKLSGALIESRLRDDGIPVWIVGIGINCLQQQGHLSPQLAQTATSLEIAGSRPVDRTALAVSVLTELDRWLSQPEHWDQVELRDAWLARCDMVGRRVVLHHAGKVYSGSMIDLDPNAALLVQLDEGGVRAFAVAETTLTRYG